MLGQTGLLDAPSEQTVASLLILLGYLLVTGAIYAVGELIKQRLANESTEALQTLAGMVAAIVAGAALVNVWNQTDAVVTALENIKPSVDALVRGLIALLAVGVTYTLTRITKRFVQVSEDRDAISRHQREILHHVVQIALFVPAFLFVLGLFKVGAGNVLLSASVLGVVFGFAARQTLGAVLAGFVLLDRGTQRATASPEEVSLPLVALALALIVGGSAVYAFSTRFRTEGMGKPKDDTDEGSNNG